MQEVTGSDYKTPLTHLSDALGDSAPTWPAREEFDSIVYWNEDFSRQVAVSIPINVYQELSAIFGSALTFRFSLGGAVVLDLSQPITQEVMDRFQERTRQATTLIIDFQLDKKVLIESHYPDLTQSCRTFL